MHFTFAGRDSPATFMAVAAPIDSPKTRCAPRVSLNDSLDPCDDVEALGPAHADIVAAGALVGAGGGCEHVHAAVVESLDVSGHTDRLVGISMQADGVVVCALRRSKIPCGELSPVVRGEAAALAVLFKPRPRLGFLGIRLLTFLSSLPSCIIFMV